MLMTRGCGCDQWLKLVAEQAFGRGGIAHHQQQEVDSGTRGIDGPIEVTPSALRFNIGFIDAPGFVGRLEMTAQPLFQFGAVTLHPTPNRRVIRRQTALRQQLLDIAQRTMTGRYQRTAQRISSGAVCRHLKTAGRVACFTVFSAYSQPRQSCDTFPRLRATGPEDWAPDPRRAEVIY